MTRTLTLAELAARRTQLALARETARVSSATARRLLKELVDGATNETDERQLALPVALEPQAPAAGPARWRVDSPVSYPAISLVVEPPPTPEQLGLSALAVSLLEEMRAEPDRMNQRIRLSDLVESGVDEAHALDAIAELVAVAAVSDDSVHHYGPKEWELLDGNLEWPDPKRTLDKVVEALPVLCDEVFCAFDIAREAIVPVNHAQARLEALEQIHALERAGVGWCRVRRVSPLEVAIIDAVNHKHVSHYQHVAQYLELPQMLCEWSIAELHAAGVRLFRDSPGALAHVEETCNMLLHGAYLDRPGGSLMLLARSIHMPPVLVLEALELLESRGLAKSKTTADGETSWDVSKPKTEKKPAPKKAKKTSEVRA